MATPNMGLVLPTDHADSDVWGVILESVFTLIDQHDHSTGKGVKVPSAGLKINGDVSWSFAGTNYAITDAKAIDFTPLASALMTGYSSALFVNASDSNNLYFRNASGTNVRITNGGTLDITIVGGIGGDYSAISALFDFDDATDTYRMRQQVASSVRQFAKVSCADVQLFEYQAAGATPVPSNAVRLKSPASLAASYNVTFPATVPASQSVVTMSTSGALLLDGSLPHGDRVRVFSPVQGFGSGAGAAPTANNTVLWIANGTWTVPLTGFMEGDRIKSVTFSRSGDSNADCAVSVFSGTSSGSASLINPGAVATNIINAPPAATDTTIDVTDTTLASGGMIYIAFAVTGFVSLWELRSIRVTYDRP